MELELKTAELELKTAELELSELDDETIELEEFTEELDTFPPVTAKSQTPLPQVPKRTVLLDESHSIAEVLNQGVALPCAK